ncbi:uncharacterized protein SPAR_E01990 [Saccharomyces paradoxus]|uniref:Uncharacterized protein n=1 Tax=Saccharomyces paradoxus TaxID=27291 RepID=A0A8B8UQ97_SACPA|nr:uncharacterized protein SPAR_E01990 [Saccharomyces paradoxus]QHS72910.1 hypothetical protein SPAR_E01990 [Saccharomyces paradoxus]
MESSRLYYKNPKPAEEKSEGIQQNVHYHTFAVSDGLNASVSNEYGNQVMDLFWNTSISSHYADNEADKSTDSKSNLLSSIRQRVYSTKEPDTISSAFPTASYTHENFDFRNLKLK